MNIKIRYTLFLFTFVFVQVNAQIWTKEVTLNRKVQKILKPVIYINDIIDNRTNGNVLGEFLNEEKDKFVVYYRDNIIERTLEICQQISPQRRKSKSFIIKIDSLSVYPEQTKKNATIHKSYLKVEFIKKIDNQYFSFGKIEQERNNYGADLNGIFAKTLKRCLESFNIIVKEKSYEMEEISNPFELNKAVANNILNVDINDGIYETFAQLVNGEPSVIKKVGYTESEKSNSIYVLKEYSFEESLSINAFVADSAIFIKLGNIKNEGLLMQSGFIKSKIIGRFCLFEANLSDFKNLPKVYYGENIGENIGEVIGKEVIGGLIGSTIIGTAIGEVIGATIGSAADNSQKEKENSILDKRTMAKTRGSTSFIMDGITGEIIVLNEENLKKMLYFLDRKLLLEFTLGDKSKEGQIEFIKKVNARFN